MTGIEIGFLKLTSNRFRPEPAGHDWPLYGDGYDRMKFGNVLTDFKRRVGNAF